MKYILTKPIITLIITFSVFRLANAQSDKLVISMGGGTYLGDVQNSSIVRPYYYNINIENPLNDKWDLWYELGTGQHYLGFYYNYLKENTGILGANRNNYAFMGFSYKFLDKKWGTLKASSGFGISSLQDITYYQPDSTIYYVDLHYRINPTIPLRLAYDYKLNEHVSAVVEGTMQLLGSDKIFLNMVGFRLKYHFLQSKGMK